MSNDVYLFGYLGSGINHLRWLVLLAEEYEIPGLEDKLSGIANTAYGRNKWLNTWITLETKWRRVLENHKVQLLHNDDVLLHKYKNKVQLTGTYDDYVDKKTIFLDRTPEACLKHYFKLNSNLNGISFNDFLKSVAVNRTKILDRLPSIMRLDAEFLDTEHLDIKVIDKINNHLNINIPFNDAAILHRMWYHKNLQAEKKFLSLTKDFYEREN
tara:strand:- start:131 stop:769 length:639 start_codon:yes stop_codon:yes gene_type:complete